MVYSSVAGWEEGSMRAKKEQRRGLVAIAGSAVLCCAVLYGHGEWTELHSLNNLVVDNDHFV